MANEEMIQKHLDNFLAKIAGETPVDDTIQNSTEFWINKIAEQGGGGSEVVANPTLEGGEDDLTSIEIDGTKYAIPEGSSVEANPTLAGTEADLVGIEVDGTKYKVGGGTKLYQHFIRGSHTSFSIISNEPNKYTNETLATYLYNNGVTSTNKSIYTNGHSQVATTSPLTFRLYYDVQIYASSTQVYEYYYNRIDYDGTAFSLASGQTSNFNIIEDMVTEIN